MKNISKKFFGTIILLSILATFGTISAVYSTPSTAQTKTKAFIDNVLPFDVSSYTITLKNQYTMELPAYLDNGFSSEVVTYTLESEENTFDVICKIRNGVLTYCLVDFNGSAIANDSKTNLIDSTADFLDKYQNYTNDDLQKMKDVLTNIDATKNMTITKHNIKLSTNVVDVLDIVETTFSWTNSIDGVDYTKLSVTYNDGTFISMSDNRKLYTIGNSAVKISKEEAIKIAMDYIKNYSYTMPIRTEENEKDSIEITNFTVNESQTVADLTISSREDNALYPFWAVLLNLTEIYPGSVYALRVGIWADSGAVVSCTNQAVGGILTNDFSEPESNQELNANLSQANWYYLLIATIVIAISIISVVVFKKRKQK